MWCITYPTWGVIFFFWYSLFGFAGSAIRFKTEARRMFFSKETHAKPKRWLGRDIFIKEPWNYSQGLGCVWPQNFWKCRHGRILGMCCNIWRKCLSDHLINRRFRLQNSILLFCITCLASINLWKCFKFIKFIKFTKCIHLYLFIKCIHLLKCNNCWINAFILIFFFLFFFHKTFLNHNENIENIYKNLVQVL